MAEAEAPEHPRPSEAAPVDFSSLKRGHAVPMQPAEREALEEEFKV